MKFKITKLKTTLATENCSLENIVKWISKAQAKHEKLSVNIEARPSENYVNRR